jgi:hypothetical protein
LIEPGIPYDFVSIENKVMRVFIYQVKQNWEAGEPTSFEFIHAMESAWFWRTKEAAQRAFAIWQGITVQASAIAAACTDFRFEPRPQGGFVISCEHPHPEAVRKGVALKGLARQAAKVKKLPVSTLAQA